MRRLLLAFFLSIAVENLSAQSKMDLEWGAYANDGGGSHYSPAADINRETVANLGVAWTYHTGMPLRGSENETKAAFEATAVMVGGTLYLSTPFDKVIAL